MTTPPTTIMSKLPPTVPMFPTVAAKRAKNAPIDPEMLKIERGVPIPGRKTGFASKYETLIGRMLPGDCIRCEPSEVQRVASAIKKAITKGLAPKLDGCVPVIRQRCEDGHGRVWADKPDA